METKEIDLTKYRNLHFKAVVDGGIVSGQIFPEATCHIRLDFGYKRIYLIDDDLSRLIDGKSIELNCSLISDFEIEPRNPETYRDWQVGDMVHRENPDWEFYEVIFRSGRLVGVCAYNVDDDESLHGMFTCEELFRRGYRLVLTDIEQQIIEKKKKYEPQDGDICYVEDTDGYCSIFIYKNGFHRTNYYASLDTDKGCSTHLFITGGHVVANSTITVLRPATDEEKQKLFDAMAKEGKRWNAEKKVVEDIPKPHEFRKGEPVLVRKDNGRRWQIGAFADIDNNYDDRPYVMINGNIRGNFKYCIPYNERTMHLLGTAEDYKEE